jgi:hypothetical protein
MDNCSCMLYASGMKKVLITVGWKGCDARANKFNITRYERNNELSKY